MKTLASRRQNELNSIKSSSMASSPGSIVARGRKAITPSMAEIDRNRKMWGRFFPRRCRSSSLNPRAAHFAESQKITTSDLIEARTTPSFLPSGDQ
jgi:hypothetical protein